MKRTIRPLITVLAFLLIRLAPGCEGGGHEGTPPPPPPPPPPPGQALIPFCSREWFLLGVNYPWINYGHDFGTTGWGHNGVTAEMAQWWRHQTDECCRGITKVMGTGERSYGGSRHSLELLARLDGRTTGIVTGEAFADLRFHAPAGVQAPVNLEGVPLRCWVYAPPGSGGERDRPNGFQVFAKDEASSSEYGSWVNIAEGEWNEVILTPSRETPDNGTKDPEFDPARIEMIGVKVGIGTGSSAAFEGSFFVDSFQVGDDLWFDFESPSVPERDFQTLSDSGVRVVRWFMFADGRAALLFDSNGLVTGVDDYFYDDVDEALSAAKKNGVFLIPVLFDFHMCDTATFFDGVQMGGRCDLVFDAAKRQSLIDTVVDPLLSRYETDSNILAWDIINEPEWAMVVDTGCVAAPLVEQPAPAVDMQEFVSAIARTVRQHGGRVTVGSATRGCLGLWAEAGLDFYQYHYYGWMESSWPFDVAYANLNLDKPCVLGEFSKKQSSIDAQEYLDKTWSNGFGGALGWSFYPVAELSDFSPDAFSRFREDHPGAPVDIRCDADLAAWARIPSLLLRWMSGRLAPHRSFCNPTDGRPRPPAP